MKLHEFLEVIAYNGCEVDLKVAYSNEYGEECTFCRTYVREDKFKEGKKYWAEDRVTKYSCIFPIEKLERYADFTCDMIHAEGKDHFFVFAHNFNH